MIVWPQAFRTILPPYGNDFVAMVKDSSLVSVLGVADITQMGKVYAAGSLPLLRDLFDRRLCLPDLISVSLSHRAYGRWSGGMAARVAGMTPTKPALGRGLCGAHRPEELAIGLCEAGRVDYDRETDRARLLPALRHRRLGRTPCARMPARCSTPAAAPA